MRATVDHLLRAFAYNINLRIADEDRSNVVEAIRVVERSGSGARGTSPTSISAAAGTAARQPPRRRRWSRS